jgi:hypothetical protein
MKLAPTLVLLATSASSTLGQVCGGGSTTMAVGVLQLCNYETIEDNECSYQGYIWDANCNVLGDTQEPGPDTSVICHSYDNGFSVTCASGSSDVTSVLNPTGITFTCVSDPNEDENCNNGASSPAGTANVFFCCTPS